MHFTQFRPVNSITHYDKDETGQNALCDRYLYNRRTGKDATKPRTLGLLGHSGLDNYNPSIGPVKTLHNSSEYRRIRNIDMSMSFI